MQAQERQFWVIGDEDVVLDEGRYFIEADRAQAMSILRAAT